MSQKEGNSKSIKYTTTSNESVSRKEVIPTKTTKSSSTQSYEYFNQQSLPKNRITENQFYTYNQQSNSNYSSSQQNKQNSNSKFISKKRVIQGKSKVSQENSKLSGSNCDCQHSNENIRMNKMKYGKSNYKTGGDYSTSGLSQKQLFGEKKYRKNVGLANVGKFTGNANYGYKLNNQYYDPGYQFYDQYADSGYQLYDQYADSGYQLNDAENAYYGAQLNSQQQRNLVSSKNSLNNNLNQNYYYDLRTYQGRRTAPISGNMAHSQTLVSKKRMFTRLYPNEPRFGISEKRYQKLSLSSGKKGKRIETDSNFCTCPEEKNRYLSLSVGRKGKRLDIKLEKAC